MPGWTDTDLDRFAAATEIEISAIRPDGRSREGRTIWIVRVGDDLYVRAAYGAGSTWHRVAQSSGRARMSAGGAERDVAVSLADPAVLDEVDVAYRAKYGRRYASIVDSITAPEQRSSTLRLDPRGT